MSNRHNHVECEHKLQYCKTCKVPYCVTCGKEWQERTQTITGPWYNGTITDVYKGGQDVTPNITFTSDCHTGVKGLNGNN